MNRVEVDGNEMSVTDVFELPLDNGIFVRNGIKTLLKVIRKKAPSVRFHIDKKEKSVMMSFKHKMTTTEVFQMVDSVMDLLDTKTCPVCGIGLFLGYNATPDRLCKRCRDDWTDYRFLLEPTVVPSEDLDGLEYEALEASLNRLGELA